MESIEKKLFLTEKINAGTRGAIYRFPNTTYVAKIRHDENKKKLYHEFKIAKDLYNAGIKVAKPINLTKVFTLNDGKKVERLAFIQEELEGENLDKMYILDLLNHSELCHAKNLGRKEVKKAINRGFLPRDTHALGNFIYNKKEDIVYLIDFEDWSKKDF
ncbi:MAG: hypothetical protein Q8O84_01535 [Nanoarchaeota archaeon]|nr:hypothetical protein [Nanoarchaeota archaeon]